MREIRRVCLLSILVRLNQLYALSSVSQHLEKPLPLDQVVHSPVEDIFAMWQCSPKKFRVSYANKDFALCPSYPEASIVPKAVSDDDLKKVKQQTVTLYM